MGVDRAHTKIHHSSQMGSPPYQVVVPQSSKNEDLGSTFINAKKVFACVPGLVVRSVSTDFGPRSAFVSTVLTD